MIHITFLHQKTGVATTKKAHVVGPQKIDIEGVSYEVRYLFQNSCKMEVIAVFDAECFKDPQKNPREALFRYGLPKPLNRCLLWGDVAVAAVRRSTSGAAEFQSLELATFKQLWNSLQKAGAPTWMRKRKRKRAVNSSSSSSSSRKPTTVTTETGGGSSDDSEFDDVFGNEKDDGGPSDGDGSDEEDTTADDKGEDQEEEDDSGLECVDDDILDDGEMAGEILTTNADEMEEWAAED